MHKTPMFHVSRGIVRVTVTVTVTVAVVGAAERSTNRKAKGKGKGKDRDKGGQQERWHSSGCYLEAESNPFFLI